MNRTRLLAALSTALFAGVGLTACGAPKDAASSAAAGASSAVSQAASGASQGASSGAVTACAASMLPVKTPGRLTIGTDKPAYAPWFKDDDPANGGGYEGAVAYAIAEKMGFAKNEVTWIVAPFDSVIAPGAKKFDLDLNQVSITADRAKVVDFSSGYYDVRQAIVSYEGSPIAGKTALADLASAKLGAMVGTTSLTALQTSIKPTTQPMVYNSNDLAVAALKNKQVDGIVVDLPTAFYLANAVIDKGVIVGQLPADAKPEQFGAVLDKGSALTACVSSAVDALRADGTLAKLAGEWLAGGGAPELK